MRSALPEILNKVFRKYRHDYDRGDVPGFDYEGTIKIVNALVAENKKLKRLQKRLEKQIKELKI